LESVPTDVIDAINVVAPNQPVKKIEETASGSVEIPSTAETLPIRSCRGMRSVRVLSVFKEKEVAVSDYLHKAHCANPKANQKSNLATN
jgi:hypothetical protein